MTLADVARTPHPRWSAKTGALLATVLRYGMSTAGPVAVSGAHFLASLVFLRALPTHQFGLFSFVMVVVSFGMSLNVSLIAVPITRHLVTGAADTRPVCFQMNWLVCGGFALLLLAALLASGAPMPEAAVLALFAFTFTFRWFARCFAFVDGRAAAAIRSDMAYSGLLCAGLGTLALAHRMNFLSGSLMLLAAAAIALAPFGMDFLRTQARALGAGKLRAYRPIFRDLTRWSLVGVVLTEVTVNAHAYLVTFIAGPGAFALLALGMLLLRPASLMQSALPDLERPAMARAIAARDMAALARIQRNFLCGLSAAWAGNMALIAGLLAFFPLLLLKKGYSLHDVIVVAAISAVIMAVRTWRTPLAVLLQAAGLFKEMARIGWVSGAASVAATLALLLAFGPIASLGGILVGELIILVRVRQMARDWKASHA